MAIAVYTSTDEKWSFAEQTTWGTAVGDSAAQVGILTEGFGINSEINFRNPPRARAQRYSHTNDVVADTKGVVFNSDGANGPGVKDYIDYLFYGVMQNVTESSGTPFQKTFTFGQTQPDFSANAGIFFTLWNKAQVASTSQKLYDAIISELTLSCAPDANESILWAAPTWIGRTHSDTANPSGTVTYPDFASTDQFNFYDIGVATLGGSSVVLGNNGVSITIRNNASKVGQSSGVPQTFALPRYEVEMSWHILWDSVARTMMSNARAGTAVAFELEWGSSGSDGHLEFTGSSKIMNAVNLEHAQEGNFVTVNLACEGIYGTTEPFQVIHSNAVDRGW